MVTRKATHSVMSDLELLNWKMEDCASFASKT